MKDAYVVAITTVADQEFGQKLVRGLLEERLIACGNVFPKGKSLYWWEGKICEDDENVILMKTRLDKIEDIKSFFKTRHPYSVPELIALPIKEGAQDYLSWINQVLER